MARRPAPKGKPTRRPAAAKAAPVPDINRPKDPPDAITKEAYESGQYKLRPQIAETKDDKFSPPRQPDGSRPPDGIVETPPPAPPEAPQAAADGEAAPTPPELDDAGYAARYGLDIEDWIAMEDAQREAFHQIWAEGEALAESVSDDFAAPELEFKPATAADYVVPTHIRMVHPDPTATADGFRVDDTGAILVPLAQVADMQSHGYSVEHAHEAPED